MSRAVCAGERARHTPGGASGTAAAGRQAYVVYPLIDESAKLEAKAAAAEFEKWGRVFAPHRCELLHGRIPPEEKDAILKFKGHAKRQEVPCVAYFDFETAMVPKDERRGQTQVVAHNDQVLSVAFAAVGRDGYEVPKEFLREDYSGTDPEIWLIFRFLALARDYMHRLEHPVPIQMTPEDEERFVNANECHLCGETLCDDRVRDHNHFTGKFRGATHRKCNLEYKLPKIIMVYAWNLAGFDGHIIVRHCENIWYRRKRVKFNGYRLHF